MRGDDLVPLLIPPPQQGLGFRQGVILEWDPATAHNAVQVAGTIMTDLPILNTNEAVLLSAGAVVAVITYGSSWFILGRITIPGTPEAASALSMVRTYVDSVTALEATTTTAYGDLATVGPSVTLTVGPSGRVLTMISSLFDYNGNDTQAGGYMSVQISGPTTRAPSDFGGLMSTLYAADPSADTVSWIAGARMTAASLHTGLAGGEYTITAKYRAMTSAGCQFGARLLVAIPL